NSVTIDATHAASDTGFFASTLPGSTGRGGSITVAAKEFLAIGNSDSRIAGGIVARSATDALAGDIFLRSDNVTLDANAIISSANIGSGPAGSVSIGARNAIVLQDGSLITATSQAS